jgi:hypothetical protein
VSGCFLNGINNTFTFHLDPLRFIFTRQPSSNFARNIDPRKTMRYEDQLFLGFIFKPLIPVKKYDKLGILKFNEENF